MNQPRCEQGWPLLARRAGNFFTRTIRRGSLSRGFDVILRGHAMRAACILAAVVSFFTLTPYASAQANATGKKQPNILFIAIDDLNDWIGCLGGHPQAQTPNLDRLAKKQRALHARLLRRPGLQSVAHRHPDRAAAVDHRRLPQQSTVAAGAARRRHAARVSACSTATSSGAAARSSTAAIPTPRRGASTSTASRRCPPRSCPRAASAAT